MRKKERAVSLIENNEQRAADDEERAPGFPSEDQVVPRRDRFAEGLNTPHPRNGAPPITSRAGGKIAPSWKAVLLRKLAEVNKELWLILSMMVIAGAMNYVIASHRIILGFYTLPTLLSAYCFGRRHAVLTATASVLIVVLVANFNSVLFTSLADNDLVDGRWYELGAWGGILVVTAYAMGTLYERQKSRLRELHKTYRGLLIILRQFVAKDKFTENHCYRVSIYASEIAETLGLNLDRIEDVRAASLLHDIGKLDTSRELLYKAARLTEDEFNEVKKHADKGAAILEPVGGPLHRIIPIILAHHEKYDGSGYHALDHDQIPLESRIIAVADTYDSLTSDRPYRKAVSTFEAKEIIVKSAGVDFDPAVVEAFVVAFSRGAMEIPELVV